jgi:UPF0271 protein
MKLKSIDLNSDIGESFGIYSFGNDEQILDYITSANIACGYHAGDHNVMHATVKLAAKKGVAIGAHPGFKDLIGFGRREIQMPLNEIYNSIIYQIGALYAFSKLNGCKLAHIKPHGALYNMAARDMKIADVIANAVYDFDKNLSIYALSGSCLVKAAKEKGLKVLEEVFADRTYRADGTLTPRSHRNSLIHSAKEAAEQIIDIVLHQKVYTIDGTYIKINADTVCVHGDTADAVSFLKTLRDTLEQNNIKVEKPS